MILGPACSAAAELMGEIAEKHLNIPQVFSVTTIQVLQLFILSLKV